LNLLEPTFSKLVCLVVIFLLEFLEQGFFIFHILEVLVTA
jgi:hypothetical protein